MKPIIVTLAFVCTLVALLALPQPQASAIGVLRVTSTPIAAPTPGPSPTPDPTSTPEPAAYPYPAPQIGQPALVRPTPRPRRGARPNPCRAPMGALVCGVLE